MAILLQDTPTGGGATPAGIGNELQYRVNGTTFGAVSTVKSNGSILQRVADNSPIIYDFDVRADTANLNQRLDTMAKLLSTNVGGIVSGFYYDNNPSGGVATLAGAANRIDLSPYFSPLSMTINQIGCAVSTAVAASLFKIVIYSSSASGWPDTLLYESANLSGAAVGYISATLSFTFQSGVKYWLGVRHSSTCTLRTIAVASAYSLGLGNSGAAASQMTVLRRTLTFATAATNPWAFTSTDLVANITPPSIRFRVV